MAEVWYLERMPKQSSSEKALLLDKHAYQISHLIAEFTVPLMRKLYHQFDGEDDHLW